MTSPKRLSAGLLATAVAAGGAVVALGFEPGSAAGELPPPPPLLEMSAVDPVVPGDGLERLVVTVPSTAPGAGGPPAAGSAGVVDGDESGSSSTDDGGLAGYFPAEAQRIVVDNGRLGYLDGDGAFTPFGGEPDDQPTMLETLAALPGVESVEPISDGSFAVRTSEPERLEELTELGVTVTEDMLLAFSADPYEPYQWSLDNTGTNLSGVASLPNVGQTPDADIDGVEARLGATGRGVVVAIVDSGVDLSHPELAHAAWINPGEDCDSGAGNGIDDDGNGYIDDCSGWDFGDNDREMFDGSNNVHGTHVAGIVAARSGNGQGVAGVAPDAKIMDLKVSDRWGAIPSSSIARAIRYAVDNGADVVNLSLGSQPGAPIESAAEMASAVDYARVNGVLLVVAAGNNGISLDRLPVYPASLNTSNMLVVGATDPNDHPTPFSNVGSALDLFAPGLYILSTTPNAQLAFQSGTSQASPIVAGAAALAVESLGTSGPAAVIDRLTASADSLPQLHEMAANPLRVNSARAVGVAVGAAGVSDGAGDSGGSAGSVGSVTIRGLAGDEIGRVSASIAIAVEDEAFDQPFQWEASLFAIEHGRKVFAVTDHEVTAGPVAAAETVLTDERGAVVLAPDTTPAARWDTVLPGGTYALLIEAVPNSDPDLRLGDGFLATFVVAGPPGADGGFGSDDGSGSGTDGRSGSDDSTSGGTGGSEDGGTTDGSGDDSTSGGSPTGDSTNSGGGGDATDPGSGGGSGSGPGGGMGGSTGGGTTGGSGSGSGGGTGQPSGGDTGDPGSGGGSGSGSGGGTGAPTGGPTGGPSGTSDPMGGSGSGSNGDWAVVEISPPVGFVDTNNVVHVFGSFSDPVTVWFGNSAARTVSQSDSLLIVQTERRARPGSVDVSLRRRSEEVLRLPQAYSFVDLDGGSGADGDVDPDPGGADGIPADGSGGTPSAESGGPTGGTGGTSSGSGATGGTDGSAGGGDTGDPGTGSGGDSPTGDGSTGGGSTGGSDGDGSGGGDDGPVGGTEPRPRVSIDGDPTELGNGLIGVPVRGINVVGPIPSCGIDACRAWRV